MKINIIKGSELYEYQTNGVPPPSSSGLFMSILEALAYFSLCFLAIGAFIASAIAFVYTFPIFAGLLILMLFLNL